MSSQHSSIGRSRGFTLVEMSIVLVIIGLIIGGILKGQEVIASARQKAVINQINAVRAATNTYFDRYRALPGDDPTAATVIDANLTNGDGSGIVGPAPASSGAIANNASGATGENYFFFDGLIAANLLNGGQVTNAASTAGFGISSLPASPITGAGLTIMYGTHAGDGTNASTTKKAHWLRLHKGPATPVAAISPRTQQNIDAGIDDGLPDTGGIRGDNSGCNGAAAVGGRYTVSDNTTCFPLFEVSQ